MTDANFVTSEFTQDSGTAEMAGWDTVYAVRVPIINAALRRHFDNKAAENLRFSHDTAGAAVQGTFGAWQLVTGGSGTRLMLSIPIVSGSATIPLTPVQEYDLAGAAALVEVTLGFHAVEPLPADGRRPARMRHDLKVGPSSAATASYTSAGLAAPPSTDSDETTIKVHRITGAVNKAKPFPLDQLAIPMIGTVLEAWLAENTDIFDFVFLTVDVAEHVTGAFEWVAPTSVGYAITDMKDAGGKKLPIEHSIFAVLAMTEGRPPKGVGDNASPNSIPINEGVDAAFLIAPRLLMKKFLAPGLPTLFGVDDGSFVIGENGKTISNCADLSLQLTLPEDSYVSSNPVKATIPSGDFSMTIYDTHIEQEFLNIGFVYGTDNELNVQVSLVGNSTLGLDSNGHFALQMQANPRSSISAQPDQKKIASEQVWAMSVTLVLMMVTAVAFARLAGGARSLGKAATDGTSKVLSSAESQVVEEVSATVESGVSRAIPLEVAAEATTLSSSTLTAEIVEVAGAEMQQGGGKWALSGLFQNFCAKTLMMMLAQTATQAVGQVWANVSNFDLLKLYKNEPGKIPTLVDFGTHCVSPMVWPRTEGAQLVCAGLNGALVLGFKLSHMDEQKAADSSAPALAQTRA